MEKSLDHLINRPNAGGYPSREKQGWISTYLILNVKKKKKVNGQAI